MLLYGAYQIIAKKGLGVIIQFLYRAYQEIRLVNFPAFAAWCRLVRAPLTHSLRPSVRAAIRRQTAGRGSGSRDSGFEGLTQGLEARVPLTYQVY